MAAEPRQADDLDLLLRDSLREIAAADPDSSRAWGMLRRRIERARRPVCLRPPVRLRGEPLPREWTLDWHLVSLGRMAR